MAYKLFQGKWRVSGDKPMVSIMSGGVFCFNTSCYLGYIKPNGYEYAKVYYDSATNKIAFELRKEKTSDFAYPIRVTQTKRLALVSGKAFLNYYKIPYGEKPRSYTVHPTTIHAPEPNSGYQDRYRVTKGIEIHLNEHKEAEK